MKDLIASFLIIHCLLSTAAVRGQGYPERDFQRNGREDGLSHDHVSGILQDSIGFVWLSTSYGLNRFNGTSFTQYHATSDSLSLSSENIGGMSWIDDRRIAVFTAGLHIIDTRTGERRNIYIPYEDKRYEYKFNVIEAVCGDREGNLYVLSRSGFYHFDINYNLVSRFDYYKKEEIQTEHFFYGRDLYRLDDHRLLIISIGGLYQYDKRSKKTTKLKPEDEPMLAEFLDYPGTFYTPYRFLSHTPDRLVVLKLLSDSLVYIDLSKKTKVYSRLPYKQLRDDFHYRTKLYSNNDSSFYLTSHYWGFFRFSVNPRTGKVIFNPERYFSTYSCNGLLVDKDENLWVATNKGVFRQDVKRFKVVSTMLRPGLLDTFPQLKIEDVYAGANKVYSGSRGWAGLLVFDRATLKLEKQYFGKNNSLAHPIYAVEPIDENRLMLGVSGPVFEFDVRTGKETKLSLPDWGDSTDWTSDLFTDSRGDIWVGAANIYRYRKATGKFEKINHVLPSPIVPFAIREDANGNMWIASHGLVRYNVSLDSFDLIIDSFPAIKMMDNQINAMEIDRHNTIWLNCNNNGLIGYSIDKKTFVHFTRDNGLPDNNIAAMKVIGNKLWIACFSGIACMDTRSYRITSFGKEDGFPEMPIVRGAEFHYDSTTKEIFLGLSHALVKFNPYEMLLRRTPPQLFIESVNVSGKKEFIFPSEELKISWKESEVMINIGSISFTDGPSQQFAYRIIRDGTTQWQFLGEQTRFSISNLRPGDYRIQVKSFSLHNRWPEQLSEIRLVVNPPFWQKEWFIALMSLLAAVFIYLLIRWRSNVARRKEMKNTHLQKLKAEEYKNQFELEQISNYFSSSLEGKKTEEEVLWDVTNNLIGRLDYVDCMIYLWNEDKTKMVQKAAYGPKGKPEMLTTQVFDVEPGQGIVGHVMETMQPVLLRDTRKDSRYRVDEAFRLSEICVPIIHNGELMGIIDSEHHEPDYFTERDIKILTTIATLIGNKLTQLKAEQILEVKRKELDNINEQLVEARLAALQAQMNPHFVFNALNSIKRMILESDNEKASRYLSKFALMIRMTLDHSRNAFVTLDENISYLKAYLEMEQLRFDDSFEYCIDVEEDLDGSEVCIPSMMLQPLVENAIWHGLMPKDGEKKIWVHFMRTGYRIVCTIRDNGIGLKHSADLKVSTRPLHKSHGLENLRNRIRIMNEKYGFGGTLELNDMSELEAGQSGTKVVLSFNTINI